MSSRARPGDREDGPAVGERRRYQRHPGNAVVRIIRESDPRRLGLPVELIDLSITGLGVISPESFATDERVKIQLHNDIRRFFKEVHGAVRWSRATDDGKFRVGIALSVRFSSLDMQLLKQVGLTGDSGQKVWM
jgi:PilZ domain-containing protein